MSWRIGWVDRALPAQTLPVDGRRTQASFVQGSAGPGILCNPFTQINCRVGEKCTWIIDVDGMNGRDPIGHIGCVANGTVDAGSCTFAKAGVNNGTDVCIGGQFCLSGNCKQICDPTLVGDTGPGACTATESCYVFAGLFEVQAGQQVAGVCQPQCDPLTQALVTGPAACGSVDPTQPSRTCVATCGFQTFQCADAVVYDRTDRVPPLADSTTGVPYTNGCAPGFMPFYLEDASGSMQTLCSGMCAPVKMDRAIATSPGTPANIKPWGDTNALGKLIADPAPVAGRSGGDTSAQ